ncbi:hypothetical protein [Sulfurivermis fontis]|uniref:hypothetical protein n=1 Tax=Sulfurivermis fontis TaxID=1972068 RepID=UPI000FDC9529|nr:hypothetical protein [Sulfurivermis fontis]
MYCLFLLPLLAVSPVGANSLAQLEDLAAGGAPRLALALLEQQQPAWQDDAAGWMAWERHRVQLLAAGADWQALHDRTAQLPADIPADFSRWAQTWRARALVELGQGEAARRLLRSLLWGGNGTALEVTAWRRLVIQSYRADGRGDDAYAAMLRYRHDYGRGGQEDALLGAQVLLGQGRAADAVEALQGLELREARPLLLLARLRSGQWEARRVQREARALLQEKGLPLALRQQAEAVAAEAAQGAADPAAQAIALEQVFSRLRQVPLDRELFKLTADALWEAYLAYARQVGNREQLLIGDDPAWLAKAQAAGRMYPIRVRSIYALLALHAASDSMRQQAHAALVQNLLEQEGGTELVYQLYLSSARYAEAGSIPETVRRTLLDPVIAAGDLPLAARLMAGLDEPPPGIDRVMWRLRQARVLLLGGDYAESGKILHQLVANSAELSRPELDRLIQVLFDLQTVGEHDAAYRLFEALQGQVTEVQLKRELWYWMADSRLAQERPLEAAALYLRSAMVPQPLSMDPWGQTARYQAAQALAKAGLVADARNLYEDLLRTTEDAGRKAVLRRELQQLLLVRSP